MPSRKGLPNNGRPPDQGVSHYEDGFLVNEKGEKVFGENGKPIRAPRDISVRFQNRMQEKLAQTRNEVDVLEALSEDLQEELDLKNAEVKEIREQLNQLKSVLDTYMERDGNAGSEVQAEGSQEGPTPGDAGDDGQAQGDGKRRSSASGKRRAAPRKRV